MREVEAVAKYLPAVVVRRLCAGEEEDEDEAEARDLRVPWTQTMDTVCLFADVRAAAARERRRSARWHPRGWRRWPMGPLCGRGWRPWISPHRREPPADEPAARPPQVSGFTALTENMAASGPEGGEMLAHYLNSYVEQVLARRPRIRGVRA